MTGVSIIQHTLTQGQNTIAANIVVPNDQMISQISKNSSFQTTTSY